jgi:hypothetical protein
MKSFREYLNEIKVSRGKIETTKYIKDLEVEHHLDDMILPSDKSPLMSFTVGGQLYNMYDSFNRHVEPGFLIATETEDEVELIIGYVVVEQGLKCPKGALQIRLIRLMDDYQSKGIATELYKTLAKSRKIVSDSQQYFGARKLWARLSSIPNFVVDVIDTNTCKVIESDVTIHHGDTEDDFDPRWYSDGNDKDNIVFLLKSAK